MKKLSIVIALVSLAVVAQGQTKTFSNTSGCVVEAEKRLNGLSLYITDSDKNTAVVSVLDDMSNGNITAFCPNVQIQKSGSVVELSCDKNEEAGSVTTRGQAKIDFSNGLSAVSVKGQYKGFFGWKTDTDIVCDDLQVQK